MKEPYGWRIDCFRDSYFFLSNFYPCTFTYGGLTFCNAEAAFQAQKVLTDEEKRPFTALEPVKAKRLGRKVLLRPDWDDVKVEIMYSVVKAKFEQNAELRCRLCDTAGAYLAEGIRGMIPSGEFRLQTAAEKTISDRF